MLERTHVPALASSYKLLCSRGHRGDCDKASKRIWLYTWNFDVNLDRALHLRHPGSLGQAHQIASEVCFGKGDVLSPWKFVLLLSQILTVVYAYDNFHSSWCCCCDLCS